MRFVKCAIKLSKLTVVTGSLVEKLDILNAIYCRKNDKDLRVHMYLFRENSEQKIVYLILKYFCWLKIISFLIESHCAELYSC